MQAGPVGAHPEHAVPDRVCGSFSFKGSNKSLFIIWHTQAGMLAAHVRSEEVGTALITFHPCDAVDVGGLWQYTILEDVMIDAPPADEFRVVNDDNSLVPLLDAHSYLLHFGLASYTFFLGNEPWERWGPQLQMWRRARRNVAHHNIDFNNIHLE
jgi:hypothetical protein